MTLNSSNSILKQLVLKCPLRFLEWFSKQEEDSVPWQLLSREINQQDPDYGNKEDGSPRSGLEFLEAQCDDVAFDRYRTIFSRLIPASPGETASAGTFDEAVSGLSEAEDPRGYLRYLLTKAESAFGGFVLHSFRTAPDIDGLLAWIEKHKDFLKSQPAFIDALRTPSTLDNVAPFQVFFAHNPALVLTWLQEGRFVIRNSVCDYASFLSEPCLRSGERYSSGWRLIAGDSDFSLRGLAFLSEISNDWGKIPFVQRTLNEVVPEMPRHSGSSGRVVDLMEASLKQNPGYRSYNKILFSAIRKTLQKALQKNSVSDEARPSTAVSETSAAPDEEDKGLKKYSDGLKKLEGDQEKYKRAIVNLIGHQSRKKYLLTPVSTWGGRSLLVHLLCKTEVYGRMRLLDEVKKAFSRGDLLSSPDFWREINLALDALEASREEVSFFLYACYFYCILEDKITLSNEVQTSMADALMDGLALRYLSRYLAYDPIFDNQPISNRSSILMLVQHYPSVVPKLLKMLFSTKECLPPELLRKMFEKGGDSETNVWAIFRSSAHLNDFLAVFIPWLSDAPRDSTFPEFSEAFAEFMSSPYLGCSSVFSVFHASFANPKYALSLLDIVCDLRWKDLACVRKAFLVFTGQNTSERVIDLFEAALKGDGGYDQFNQMRFYDLKKTFEHAAEAEQKKVAGASSGSISLVASARDTNQEKYAVKLREKEGDPNKYKSAIAALLKSKGLEKYLLKPVYNKSSLLFYFFTKDEETREHFLQAFKGATQEKGAHIALALFSLEAFWIEMGKLGPEPGMSTYYRPFLVVLAHALSDLSENPEENDVQVIRYLDIIIHRFYSEEFREVSKFYPPWLLDASIPEDAANLSELFGRFRRLNKKEARGGNPEGADVNMALARKEFLQSLRDEGADNFKVAVDLSLLENDPSAQTARVMGTPATFHSTQRDASERGPAEDARPGHYTAAGKGWS